MSYLYAQLFLTKLKQRGRAEKKTQTRSQLRFGCLPKATYRLGGRLSRRVNNSKCFPRLGRSPKATHRLVVTSVGQLTEVRTSLFKKRTVGPDNKRTVTVMCAPWHQNSFV